MAKPVLVLGGGIAGIQAATDLAEMGIPVYLVEKKPALGGKMAQLDKTFPTNDCSTCILAPKISDCYNHENVTTFTYSELKNLRGTQGNFTATIKKKPRYVDVDLCTGCAECVEKCPVTVEDNFNQGIDERSAIFKFQDQAVPNVVTIDADNCLKLTKGVCGLCEKTCDKGAINYDQKPETIDLDVASVVFAAGYDAFSGNIVSEYGYANYDNVITSLEYERYLSASGPTGGHVVRPSDGKEAEKIAFLHCAGSRDIRSDTNYCSSVCCMYSIKQSLITKEHLKEADLDLYYMDIRAYGKGFERYYNMADGTDGINFIRNRIAEIEKDKETDQIIIKSLDQEDNIKEENYDLVILSVGLKPNEEVSQIMKNLKIRVNKFGFADVDEVNPLKTSRAGVYASGVITGPKDIPESVIQASGSAVLAAQDAFKSDLTQGEKETQSTKNEEEYRFVDNERIKTGVFVCDCGTNIAGVIDVADVTKRAEDLPFVEHAEEVRYLCSSDGQDLIGQRIEEKGLNRIVVASCTPRTHEPLFQKAIARAGLNPYLMIMTNIRDQDSWVHREEEAKATEKAFDLIKGAAAKARKAHSLNREKIEKIDNAFVIGGGVSGMTSALELADLGFQTYLIEKDSQLGGNANKLLLTMDGKPIVNYIDDLKEKVENHPLLDIYTDHNIEQIEGYVGNYKFNISSKQNGDKKELEGGVVIVATGADELVTDEYLAQESEKVISQLDLEDMMKNINISKEIDSISMIQCVGSREEGREYCSRVCCTQAVNNAIFIKERYPDIDIKIFYREMRTYGLYEDRYREARQLGVDFIRYEVENKPEVKDSAEGLTISYEEPVTKKKVTEKTDLLVLAKAMTPGDSNEKLSKALKVPLNEDEFFLEAHVKLRPVDFATDGVFLTGLAHGPKNLGESIGQSRAAASRAAAVLTKDYLLTEAMVSTVNSNLCSACGTCEDVCAFKAIEVNQEKGTAEVNTVLCKGCGNCAAVCRSHAVELEGFTNQQLLDEMSALFSDRKANISKKGGSIDE
ncbi:MAG TPA: FAD-dependent oxidoreductase [Halanaerobiales bacterium]|nr:FAD-dependent oxidoreductase [Halanaerobiales bacterium]